MDTSKDNIVLLIAYQRKALRLLNLGLTNENVVHLLDQRPEQKKDLQKIKPENCSVPQTNENGDKLLFHLSPNDLVYVLSQEEKTNNKAKNSNDLDLNRIYKIVSFTGNRLSAIPYFVSKSIVDKLEYSQLNKVEFAFDRASIKDNCIKLDVDRLGKIKRLLN